uniref:E3 ubiquitin-protein ligase RNF123 n=1 Tax=Astyanax mexicanus TaxID=7994 RepID=A0A8B9JWK6_ASTMX
TKQILLNTIFDQRNWQPGQDSDLPGIVNEKLLSDYLHHVFPASSKHGPASATYRKVLNFQDLGAHLERLLSEDEPAEDVSDQVDGRLGPSPVVLDHTSGFEGLLFVDDDLLGVIGHSNFSSIRATTCVYKGKWVYEVLISSQGLMQIGWCTLNCRFNQEEGVGDTPDSYAYDGNRVRKWNVTTTNYGKSWAAGDIVSCMIDLDEGTITFCLNGQSLGTAFSNIKMGPGVAYFPAISLSFKESVAFNFGSRPLRYPFILTFHFIADPPTADLNKANRLLGYIKTVLSTSIDTQVHLIHLETDSETEVLSSFFHYFRNNCINSFSVFQDFEVNECLKQLMMSLLRAYRFSPIIPDLGFQIHYLRLTTAILRHEKSRKYLLSNVATFDVLRSVVFFYIKTPLRVKEAGLEELIPTTWWPTRFDKEGKDEKDLRHETAEERLRRRAYERGCQRLKKRIEVVEELQVQILRLMLNNKDKGTGEASRYIFLNKFRKFLQENASNRGNPTVLCPPEYMVCFMHRLITAVRSYWDEGKRKSAGAISSEEAYVPPQVFYNGKVDYFDLQRLGGLLSHLKKTLKDDLASKANIIIDPAEIQAASMDDLDEDEESGAAQVKLLWRWLADANLLNMSFTFEGSHGNDGLLLGRPLEEPDQPITEKSLLEILDGIVMMYNLSVHQQLGKMVVVSDDVHEYAVALKDTEEKIARCPGRRPDILEELQKSQKVFAEKLNHLSRRLAWINATIYSKEKMLDVYWLLRVCIRTIEHADNTGSLFAFNPEFYLNVAMNSYSALKNYFSPSNSMEELPGYEETLTQLAAILAKHFADPRIVGTDIKDSLMQALASYVCYPQSLRAVERIPEDQRVAMMRNLLAPYEQRPWAQTNWILVRLWRGCGFGYRYTRLPHLLKTKPEDANLPSLQKPCPSLLLQRHMAELLSQDKDMAASFLNSVLNQLNWAFSEFIGMIQEVRTMHSPQSVAFVFCALQLLNQVLNRVTAERNLFDRVVNLRLPGNARACDGRTVKIARAASVLLSDPCFQLHSIQHLLGEGEASAAGADHKHFSLHAYTDYISAEEEQKVEQMLGFLTEESKQAAATTAPTCEDDLCPICYAHSISAIFKPCSHKSCKACINQHLMNNKDCFFCKATITGVEDYSKPAGS